jgi:Fur family ferric uptake transcriptional regulator
MPRQADPSPLVPTLDPAIAPLEIIEPLCAVFRRKLRAEGLKYTPERAAVLDAVVRSEGLFEAERLIAGLKSGGLRVSKATVYRTLKLLQDAGVIQRVPIDGEQAYYQTVFGRRASDLIVRLDTRQAIPVELGGVAEACRAACEARGLTLQGHQVMIFALASPS